MSDGHTSRGFDFQYSQHIQCDHTVDGKDEARIELKTKAKPKCKKRSMGSKQVTPSKIIRRDSETSILLESSEGGSPGGVFEMPSPCHSSFSVDNMPSSVGSPRESYQTVYVAQPDMDHTQMESGRLVRDLLVGEDTSCS